MFRMKKKLFILLLVSTLLLVAIVHATTLVDMGDKVIRDTDNDIEWINHTFRRCNWADQTSTASDLTHFDESDWRLATKAELLTLVDPIPSPKIDSLFKLGKVRDWTCWSSTAVTDKNILRKHVDKSRAYAVFFGNGRSLHMSKRSHKVALYVRSRGWRWNDGSHITWNAGTQIKLNGVK